MGGGVGGRMDGWVCAEIIKIKTKLSPQLGLAKLELGLSLAIFHRVHHSTRHGTWYSADRFKTNHKTLERIIS